MVPNRITSFFLLLLFNGVFAQSLRNNEELFDLARKQLAEREIEAALLSLRKIYVNDRSNANVNFLMGAAYTEMTASSDKAIYHLKKAIGKISENYRVGSFEEKNAPVHTYYYLVVALSARDECSRAAAANKKLKNYSSVIDLYFIDEADRHMQKCPYDKVDQQFEAWLSKNEIPEGYKPDSINIEEGSMMEGDVIVDLVQADPPLANLDSLKKVELGVVTKDLEYSTQAPLYGVQIGSNKFPSPISHYSKLKNVDVFVDKEGVIRYVVGHFSYKKQAESLLERLKEEGFADAFVVNVNNERKYSSELVSYGNVNLRAGIKGEVEYFIQLGAFKDTIPNELMDLYLSVDDLHEIDYRGMTLVTIGSFPTYEAAKKRQEEVQTTAPEDLKDAFVVAFNRGEKINLQEAIKYTD